jgi:hypothetical protein
LKGIPFVWVIIHLGYFEVYGISYAGYGNGLALFFFVQAFKIFWFEFMLF